MSDVPLNNILVLPADLVAQTTNRAVLSTGLQSENTESLGNYHLLLLVVRGRDTLEDLESLQRSSTSGGLVGDHATNSLVEDSGRGTEVEGTWEVLESIVRFNSSLVKGARNVPPRVGLYRVILRR